MKKPLVALSLLASFAATVPAQTVEEGYPLGSLAVAAIERQDWRKAEWLLNQASGVRRDDPARLINLGRVYMATGRPEMARDAFERAFASTRHTEVETISGQVVSTRELSRLGLERIAARVQNASQ